MKSMVRLATVIGLMVVASMVGACSTIHPASSDEIWALLASKTGPR